jgi:hypothetical protein
MSLLNSSQSREWAAVKWSIVAVGVLVLRALDDAFLHPAPGLGPGDHLLAGTVPVVVGGVAAFVLLRSRRSPRTFAALLAGAWGLIGSMELFIESGPRGGLQADDVSGILSLGAGVFLLGAFVYFAGVSVSRGRRRLTRVLRRGATAAGVFVAAYLVALPLGVAYLATHYADEGITTAPDLGVPVERVEFTSGDGLELSGWYAPTQNGAVVLVLPGRSGIDHGRMLARHGYGVLLMNRRGEADSQGETNLFGWADPQDVAGAAHYLRSEEEIAPDAIGGLGLSVGGEVMLEHASRSDDLAGVVVEGIGSRSIKESLELSGGIRVAELTTAPLMTGGLVVLTDQAPPPNLVEAAKDLAPARALIIWGERGQPAETVIGPTYADAAGAAGSSWEVPDAGHTGGIDAAPEEYERRVIAFFDATLLSPA